MNYSFPHILFSSQTIGRLPINSYIWIYFENKSIWSSTFTVRAILPNSTLFCHLSIYLFSKISILCLGVGIELREEHFLILKRVDYMKSGTWHACHDEEQLKVIELQRKKGEGGLLGFQKLLKDSKQNHNEW